EVPDLDRRQSAAPGGLRGIARGQAGERGAPRRAASEPIIGIRTRIPRGGARISRSRCGAKSPHAKSHGRVRPHPSLSPPRTDINTTGLDCPAPKPSPLDGDSPMYRPRQLVDLATPITDTALMVHGFEALPQVARR